MCEVLRDQANHFVTAQGRFDASSIEADWRLELTTQKL